METKDGFLVINKDKGCTSHDCVKKIRKLLNTKKVGHTGTLDPEVIGTLPIAIGSATRFIQYLPQGKTYIGQIKLGIRTKTDDIHGKIINQKDLKNRIKNNTETLLIHGEADQIVSSTHLLEAKDFLIRNNVKVDTLLIKNCDHHIPIEASSTALNFILKKI